MNVTLDTALASDTSRVEQTVNGTLASAVEVDGETVIPAGSAISGHVTHAKESAKVKGRAELGFRFTTLTVGGGHVRHRHQADFICRREHQEG